MSQKELQLFMIRKENTEKCCRTRNWSGLSRLLYILYSKWVLQMPFAGGNNIFNVLTCFSDFVTGVNQPLGVNQGLGVAPKCW